MTSKLRRCDVVMSHRRQYVVMCLLGIWPPWPPNILNFTPPTTTPPPPQYSKPSYAYAANQYLKSSSRPMYLIIV